MVGMFELGKVKFSKVPMEADGLLFFFFLFFGPFLFIIVIILWNYFSFFSELHPLFIGIQRMVLKISTERGTLVVYSVEEEVCIFFIFFFLLG